MHRLAKCAHQIIIALPGGMSHVLQILLLMLDQIDLITVRVFVVTRAWTDHLAPHAHQALTRTPLALQRAPLAMLTHGRISLLQSSRVHATIVPTHPTRRRAATN